MYTVNLSVDEMCTILVALDSKSQDLKDLAKWLEMYGQSGKVLLETAQRYEDLYIRLNTEKWANDVIHD